MKSIKNEGINDSPPQLQTAEAVASDLIAVPAEEEELVGLSIHELVNLAEKMQLQIHQCIRTLCKQAKAVEGELDKIDGLDPDFLFIFQVLVGTLPFAEEINAEVWIRLLFE